MILSTHAIVGASIASLTHDPVAGFAVGFVSHFVLDAIPHWDYKLRSSRQDSDQPMKSDIVVGRDFLRDLVKIGGDVLGGFAIVALLFSAMDSVALPVALSGALGGVLPDALQFAYFKFRHEPLSSLQRFHIWIHSDRKVLDPIAGAASQFIAAAGITAYVFFA